MKKKRQFEIDSVDGLAIDDDNLFGHGPEDDKIEDFGDFVFKYFRPFYHLFKTYIPNFWFWFKSVLQRIFSRNHLANVDIWNASYTLAPRILKTLQAFYDYEKHGYPTYFSEWGYEGCTDKHGGMGMTKEEYDEARAKDEFGGGEMEAWQATIREMIFAFEFAMYHDSFDKKMDEFYKKWDLKNPFRKTPDNLSWSYSFKSKDGGKMLCDQEDFDKYGSVEAFEKEGYTFLSKSRSYHDFDALKEYDKRAEKGMRLFSKFYWNLWD